RWRQARGGENPMSPLLLAALLSQSPDAGTSSLLDEIDAAAGVPSKTQSPAASTNPIVRAFQSLNPDLSVIVDANAGVATAPAYLGVDGLRAPGLQLSWLLPLPFFVQLTAEAFSVSMPDDPTQTSTFGAGSPLDLTYTGELKFFAPVTEALSIYGGLDAAVGN